MSEAVKMHPTKAYSVYTPDEVEISVQEWGNPLGHEILLIHGFSQCHLSWTKQVTELATNHRLVTYDLRGHGSSAKPMDPRFYHEGHLWAEEMHTVLDSARLKRPVVVAWSYGGRIISDYLASYGTSRLAGINLVGSKINSSPEFTYPAIVERQKAMSGNDLHNNLLASIFFLTACAENWEAEEFQYQLAFNMLVPPQVRGALISRHFAAEDIYHCIDIPTLFTHGALDRITLLAAAYHGNSNTPGSSLSIYHTAGHCPFMEDASRFNRELAAFVEVCNR